MGFYRSLAGSVQLELTSADVSDTLRRINDMGIPVWDVQTEKELTVRFFLLRHNLPAVEKMAEARGANMKVLRRQGIFWPLYSLRRRYVLLLGVLIAVVVSLWLPTRVLFIDVEGNNIVPDRLILEAAERVGIRFGVSRRAVRSERMKNELLGALPQLRWAGVNTYGCRAVISVRERKITPQETPYSFSNIVAACDGVITSCTATDGSLLCSTGQAVQKGQVLISGYVDCGQIITTTRSSGEIYANTRHIVESITPVQRLVRGQQQGMRTDFSLLLGKKRINFRKDSGIYDGTCVKMYSEYYLTLPGGYRLPVALVKETVFVYDVQMMRRDAGTVRTQLSEFAKSRLKSRQIALSILSSQEDMAEKDGVFRLTGNYACNEMIGREQGEQIGEFHGKTD